MQIEHEEEAADEADKQQAESQVEATRVKLTSTFGDVDFHDKVFWL